MGIERLAAGVCGLDHVRETIPFARMPQKKSHLHAASVMPGVEVSA
jgi:hypothetical protein